MAPIEAVRLRARLDAHDIAEALGVPLDTQRKVDAALIDGRVQAEQRALMASGGLRLAHELAASLARDPGGLELNSGSKNGWHHAPFPTCVARTTRRQLSGPCGPRVGRG